LISDSSILQNAIVSFLTPLHNNGVADSIADVNPPDIDKEKAPEPTKQARRGRPPKAEKADKPEKEPKTVKAARPKKAPAKEEAPAPEPEQPPQPREAPRPNGPEQIVYLNISELRAFKDA